MDLSLHVPQYVQSSQKKVLNPFAVRGMTLQLILCKWKVQFAFELYKTDTWLSCRSHMKWAALCPGRGVSGDIHTALQCTYWEQHPLPWLLKYLRLLPTVCSVVLSDPIQEGNTARWALLFMLLSYWIFCLDLPRKLCWLLLKRSATFWNIFALMT